MRSRRREERERQTDRQTETERRVAERSSRRTGPWNSVEPLREKRLMIHREGKERGKQ